jgi:nucleotide-binding universal stress UspA family protein
MKSFLVLIGGSDTDDAVLETALAAARPLSAHLKFLHVRVGLDEAMRHTPHMDFAMGGALRSALHELEMQTHTRSSEAVRHIREFCSRSKIALGDARPQAVTASCLEEEGDTFERVMFHARRSDLVVTGRRHKPNGLPSDFLERLLLDCGRPVLIAGPTLAETVIGTIMVCWRESAEAARAVTAAAPLLARAKRVVFASVTERSGCAVTAINNVVRQFSSCGTPAEAYVIAPNGQPVQDLLAAAARVCAADLVVLGAYGHSHLRELVFGGCTQSFIHAADRPILLMH